MQFTLDLNFDKPASIINTSNQINPSKGERITVILAVLQTQ